MITTNNTDDIVLLGILPDPSHTPGTRAAHPRPGFIAPTATAGGDAPPTTHTTPVAAISPMASTEGRRQPAALTFTALNRSEAIALIAMTTAIIAVAFVALMAVGAEAADMIAAVAGFGVGAALFGTVSHWLGTRRRRSNETHRTIR